MIPVTTTALSVGKAEEEEEMADKVRGTVNAEVLHEMSLRGYRADDEGPDQRPQDARIEMGSLSDQKANGGKKDDDDKVFTDDLERGQALPLQ